MGDGLIAVSADGTSVYLAHDGIAVFARDRRTGALGQLASIAPADRSFYGELVQFAEVVAWR